MATRTTRRDFLKGAAATTVGLAMPTILLGSQDKGKPRFAVVGVGGRGRDDLFSASKSGVIAAMCDIDHDTLVAPRPSPTSGR
jgi:hypothetical protein